MFCSFKLFLIICLIAKIPVVYFIIVLSFNVYFYQKFQKLWIRFFFFFFADSVLLKRKGQPDKEIVKRRNFKLAEDLITMSFEVLNFFFFFFFFLSTGGGPEQDTFLSLSKRWFLSLFGLFTYCSGTMITWTFWCAKVLPLDYQKC